MSAERKPRSRVKRVVFLELTVVTDVPLKQISAQHTGLYLHDTGAQVSDKAEVISLAARAAEIMRPQ